jgi:hypothetical protein
MANLHAVRRRMANAGHDQAAIEEAIDRLADEQVQDRKDRAIEELSAQLKREGYDLDQLDRDNPYNQWMYA